MREKPTLRQYGLEYTDIDTLTRDYNYYIEHEKAKYKSKESKNRIVDFVGGFLVLCTWCAPFMGVFLILNLVFQWDTSPETLTYSAIYAIGGSLFTYYWFKRDEKAKDAQKGQFSLGAFPRKDEWERFLQYQADCKAYEEWDEKRKRFFWENLTGLQFEEEVAKLYTKMGYKAIKTRASNDGGVDVIASRGREKIAIQCKRYSKKISPSIARELYGVLCAGDYTSGIIATINGASYETLDFCSKCTKKQITIIDVNDLIRMQSQV